MSIKWDWVDLGSQVIRNDDEASQDHALMRTKWVEIINKDGNHCKIWLRNMLDISDSLSG